MKLIQLLSFTFIQSLKDLSSTEISIKENPLNNQFLIEITRTDDLISHKKGLLAERIVSIQLDLDVNDNTIGINGKNISKVGEPSSMNMIEAKLFKGTLNQHQIDRLNTKFDEGIVGVEVSSFSKPFKIKDGCGMHSGNSIFIQEKILEIEGCTLKTSNFIEQVIQVYHNGTKVFSIPKVIEGSTMTRHHGGICKHMFKKVKHHLKQLKNAIVKKWNELPTYYKFVIISFIFGIFAVFISVGAKLFYYNFVHDYEAVYGYDYEPPMYGEKV